MADVYKETGSSILSNSSFQWRQLYVPRIHGSPASEGPDELPPKGGVYHYQGSAQIALPTCRNRSIIWRATGCIIELIELSLDTNLVGNALRLHLPSGCGGVACLKIYELASHVIVLFVTCTSVHRVVLPHPETITNNARLLSAGKGLTPSVFLFVEEESLKGNNVFSLSGLTDISCSMAWFTVEGVALFVLGSAHSNSLTCMKFPPPGVTGIPETFQLQHMNVIQKFWNMLPTGIKGDCTQVPLALEMHRFGGELIIISVYCDYTLRLWSVQERMCVLEHNVHQYFNLPNTATVKKAVIKKSVDSSNASMHFALYTDIGKIGIFDLSLMNDQLVLQHISNHHWNQEVPIIDMSLTNERLWIISLHANDQTTILYSNHSNQDSQFKEVILNPLPSSNIVLPAHKDAREGILDIMFTPGHTSPQAISKTLLLYGCKNTSESQLRNDVIRQVELEIHTAAGGRELMQDELRELNFKCWNKFYSCSVQYEQLSRRPLGCGCDPYTGRVTIIQQGTISFIFPHTISCGYTSCDHLYQCIQLIKEQVSSEVFESFVSDLRYHGNPHEMANEISEVLLNGGVSLSDNEFIQKIHNLCVGVIDIKSSIEEMVSSYEHYREGEGEGEEEEQVGGISDVMDLFSSHYATQLLSCSLREECLRKLHSLIELLVLVNVLQRQDFMDGCGSIVNRLIQLIHNYHLLYWLGSTQATPTSGTLCINLKELTISQNNNTKDNTLLELCLTATGLCMNQLLFYEGLRDGSPVHMYWTELFPWLLDRLIYILWPQRNSVMIYEYLLSSCQYFMVQCIDVYYQEFITNNDDDMYYSRQLLLGHSLIGSGEVLKGIDAYSRAINGINKEEYIIEFSEEGQEGVYWTKLMRLLEQIPSYEGIVKLTNLATLQLTTCPPLLWSNLFKYSLLLKDYRLAYKAMISNTDDQRKRECLRHLATVLCQSNNSILLSELNFAGLEEEVELVLDTTARNSDLLDSTPYDILYCYHMSRDSYWKGAHKMYEQGVRVMKEQPCVSSLHIQLNCYSTAITLLSLVREKYQWIVKPALEQYSEPVIVTRDEVIKEHHLIKCKLLLIENQPSLSKQLSSIHVTVREVATLLNQYGYFDDSFILCKLYHLSYIPLYQELTDKCVELSSKLDAKRSEIMWAWLNYNEPCCDLPARGINISDQAWHMLRVYLDKLPHDEKGSCQAAVLEKLLSINYPVPQWLIEKMKVTNVAKLLYLLITYNQCEVSVQIAMDYIDGVLQGTQRETFGLKNSLHATSPSVWVPFNIIDQLLKVCEEGEETDLQEQLMNKSEEYKKILYDTCVTQKNCYYNNEM